MDRFLGFAVGWADAVSMGQQKYTAHKWHPCRKESMCTYMNLMSIHQFYIDLTSEALKSMSCTDFASVFACIWSYTSPERILLKFAHWLILIGLDEMMWFWILLNFDYESDAWSIGIFLWYDKWHGLKCTLIWQKSQVSLDFHFWIWILNFFHCCW